MKKAVEIEKLLTWAFRDELPKRQTSSAEGIWQHFHDFGFTGGGFDLQNRTAAQRYPHHGLPHRDALALETAACGLPDLVIDWDASAEAIMGHLAGLFRVHDALLVAGLRTAALVLMHAKMGTRPDWKDEDPRPYAVMPPRGPGPSIVGKCLGKNIYSIGSYCPLVWRPSLISIALGRADYAAWHHGLTELTKIRLEDHQILPPVASPRPWEIPDEPATVYRNPQPERLKMLTLGAQRPWAGPPVRRQRFPARRVALDK